MIFPSDVASMFPMTFHARYDVVRKEYIYFLYTGKTRDPFLKNYSFFINRDLDIDKMNRAAQSLVGTHHLLPRFLRLGRKDRR